MARERVVGVARVWAQKNGVESAEKPFLGVLSLGVAGGAVSAERG